MGGSWQNKPIEITTGVPKDAEGLRKSVMTFLSQKMSQGATPYGGPVAAGLDPLQVMAANIMSQQMYKRPYTGGTPINFQSQGGGSGLPPFTPNPNGPARGREYFEEKVSEETGEDNVRSPRDRFYDPYAPGNRVPRR